MPWELDTLRKEDPTKPETLTTQGPYIGIFWTLSGLQDWVVSPPLVWDVLSAPLCALCPTHPLQNRQAGVRVAAGRCRLASSLGKLQAAKLQPCYTGIVPTCVSDLGFRVDGLV